MPAGTRLSGRQLRAIYRRLSERFGPRHWWPAESPFEVVVGAVLTQNAAWSNVEQAIARLKGAGALTPRRLAAMPASQVARLIRPAGYFHVKARRLKAVVAWWMQRGPPGGAVRRMPLAALRQELLAVHGVGPETADSIALYAMQRPAFVVDAYTRRILARHGWAPWSASYEALQRRFTRHLPARVRLFNEYHALLVETGKTLCRKRRPRCGECPLRRMGRLRLEPEARLAVGRQGGGG